MMQCARTLQYQMVSQKLKCYIPVISRLSLTFDWAQIYTFDFYFDRGRRSPYSKYERDTPWYKNTLQLASQLA